MTGHRRQSSWIVTLSLAAIATVYVAFVWLPGHRAIIALRGQLQAKQTFVAQSTGLSAAVVAAEQELAKAEAVTGSWEEVAPREKDTSSLYGKIDALAKKAHLAIGRFDPQPFVLREKVWQIPITMNCTGTFSEIYQFLRGIEGLPATIWVDFLRIEKPPANSKDMKCELKLVVFAGNSRKFRLRKTCRLADDGGAE